MFARLDIIWIEKQIDQCSESQSPLFQQSNNNVAAPLAAGGNRKRTIERVRTIEIAPIQYRRGSSGADAKLGFDPIPKRINFWPEVVHFLETGTVESADICFSLSLERVN